MAETHAETTPLNVHNPELARQRARVVAARARIHAGSVPDPGIELRRHARRRAPGVAEPRGRDLREQHGDHVAAWRRVERARSAAGPRVQDVLEVVCAIWRVPVVDVLGAERTVNLVRPRQAAMYLCCALTARSRSEIARAFGRDHTTVLHAQRAVRALVCSNDAGTIDRLVEVRRRLGLDGRARLS